ncbi:Single-stranded-DNA-specific exonuclease RecJ [hydrothermal vent metagenome]|uniref:Single-stranded-DNA-specific exonuclease RecJ n=1 Tax=hydrothermal vent metagenome TaxID=652676 RepID=A0A3B1ABH0_9ZZZZ
MESEIKIIRNEIMDEAVSLPETLHPMLKQIFLARGVTASTQIEHTFDHLLPFDELKNINNAADILLDHIQQQKHILIVGDYDVDGATSCTVAIRVLRAFGVQHVDYLVPNRFEYGYGLTPEIVEVAKSKKPDLIVTVDNGIASIDGVNHANKLGIQVLITDHHLPANTVPDAAAIVNPNQQGDEFKSKHLAGVGVIFYVMLALRARLRAINWFEQQNIKEPNLANYLDLVALGTVADVVKMDHNNRILVAQGLKRIRSGQACAGIKALLKVAGRDETKIVSSDLGFSVGPRLNAAGRLDDISIGIECLLSDDIDNALEKAQILDTFNRERRKIEQGMREQAKQYIEKFTAQTSTEQLPNGLCIYDPGFHEGVIGIVAGRIKEQMHRPTIVFAKSSDRQIKGSARSIAGIHIRDVLDRIATLHPELLSKFGGHAMAAGLTLQQQDFTKFEKAFNDVITDLIDDDTLQRVIHSDGSLQPTDITLEMAELLQNFAPWGQGFPEPQFDGEFELIQRRIVGEHHLKMVIKYGELAIDAIAFQTTDHDWPEQVNRVELVYKLNVNEFNGRRSVQFLVEHIKPV